MIGGSQSETPLASDHQAPTSPVPWMTEVILPLAWRGLLDRANAPGYHRGQRAIAASEVTFVCAVQSPDAWEAAPQRGARPRTDPLSAQGHLGPAPSLPPRPPGDPFMMGSLAAERDRG